MKPSHIAGVVLLLCAFATTANAETRTGKTRAQVKAELAEAIRTGNIIAPGHSGLTLRELNPQGYPTVPTPVGKTRSQVIAELAQAIRNGDVLDGQSGFTLREKYPLRYAMTPQIAGKTREQVKAELVEAIRTGDILASDHSGLKLSEVDRSRDAKARAMAGDGMQQAASANGPTMP